MSLRRTFLAAGAALLAAGAAHAAAPKTTVFNFDERHENYLLVSGNELTTRYAAQGVTFDGDSEGHDGGYIIHGTVQSRGYLAHSGENWLSFNVSSGITGNVENIRFATPVAAVSIWGASGLGGTYTMNAYDAGGALLDTATGAFSLSWSQIAVSGAAISRIELIGNNLAYTYDDLAVTAVPEPSTYAMLLGGLGLLGWMRRRRA